MSRETTIRYLFDSFGNFQGKKLMTTTVKITAHCSKDKEVKIIFSDNTTPKTIQDGEETEYYVYDDRNITICEVFKTGIRGT